MGVNRFRHVLVAIHTSEHAAMNGAAQLRFIHMKADCLAILFYRQRGIGVTSKTVAILWLVLCVGGKGAKYQNQRTRTEQNLTRDVHEFMGCRT